MRLPPIAVPAALFLMMSCDPAPIVETVVESNQAALGSHAGPSGPTYVFLNGNIITMDPAHPTAQAIAVDGERILAVGSNGQVARLSRSHTRIVDLEGRTVMPGFVDAHTHLLLNVFPQPDEPQRILLRVGITTLANPAVDREGFGKLQAFHAAGKLQVRTSMYLRYNNNCGIRQDDWWKTHAPSRVPGERLRVAGIKMFADGGSCHKPAVSQEFSPGSGLGDLFMNAAEIAEGVRFAEEQGHQVIVHAIGDRAIRAAQDGIEAALAGRPNVLRHRIDHNVLVPEELIDRYSQIGIIPVLFGYYHPAILESREDPRRGGCPALERNSYYAAYEANTRSVLDRNPGLPVAWHGDDPGIPPVRPMRELYNMVTRVRTQTFTDFSICQPPEWLLPTRISVMEALRMMTINSAYAIFREKEVGSLEPGKFADLIVFTRDPLTVPHEELDTFVVRMTMVGGAIVDCQPGHESLCPALK